MSHVIDPKSGLAIDLLEDFMQQAPIRSSALISSFPRQDQENQRFRSDGEKGQTYKRAGLKIGRNEPCPCGSEAKYKKCCMRAAA